MKSAAALKEGAVTMEIWMAVCVKMTTVLHPHLTPSLFLAHSKIALYSHEYFIQKCAVCTSAALNTNEKLFPFWGGGGIIL